MKKIQLERFPKYIGTMSLNRVTPITENTNMMITSRSTMLAMSVERRKKKTVFDAFASRN